MKLRLVYLVIISLAFAYVFTFVCSATENQTDQKPAIDWQKGPLKASLGGFADIDIPAGFLFTDRKGTQKLLELTQNIPNGKEVGAIIPVTRGGDEKIWFVIFEFNEVGFVKDDEKGKIDADGLLKSIREGTEESNEVRKEKGWPAFHVLDWQSPPFYDQGTNNLTWAIRGRDDKGETSVNHSVRILGRRGTMNVDLVLSPGEYATVVPAFNQLINTFQFQQGNRYADFVKGDKVAEYGLTALIAGGAGALAVKTGLLLKMWKFLLAAILALKKALIAVFVAFYAAIKKLWNKIRGRKEQKAEPTDSTDNLSNSTSEHAADAKPEPVEVEPKLE
jgi:uncharacterized membrane-anchored protein